MLIIGNRARMPTVTIWQFLICLVNRNWDRMGPTFKALKKALERPVKALESL